MVLRRPTFIPQPFVMGKFVPFPFDIPLLILIVPLFLIIGLLSLPRMIIHFALRPWNRKT